MSLCANARCRKVIGATVWPGNTCGASCARAIRAIAPTSRPHPDDEEAASYAISQNRNLLDQWERAAEFHPSLPAILIYRGKGLTEQQIAKIVKLSQKTVSRLLLDFFRRNHAGDSDL